MKTSYLEPMNKITCYKTLGTVVIYSPKSPPSLGNTKTEGNNVLIYTSCKIIIGKKLGNFIIRLRMKGKE